MKACVTGATGFLGGHVARLLAERGDEVRVTYRDPERLERLSELEVKPVKADILDRAGMRRALRGADVAFHAAGFVGSRPADRVWEINALSPRVVVEAAAAEGVRRVVVTSSVAALGPAPEGEIGDESQLYRGGGLGLTYANAKHEGEREAFLAGARLGVEVVVTNPSYVSGCPSTAPSLARRLPASWPTTSEDAFRRWWMARSTPSTSRTWRRATCSRRRGARRASATCWARTTSPGWS